VLIFKLPIIHSSTFSFVRFPFILWKKILFVAHIDRVFANINNDRVTVLGNDEGVVPPGIVIMIWQVDVVTASIKAQIPFAVNPVNVDYTVVIIVGIIVCTA
jgi:hypothetical protein